MRGSGPTLVVMKPPSAERCGACASGNPAKPALEGAREALPLLVVTKPPSDERSALCSAPVAGIAPAGAGTLAGTDAGDAAAGIDGELGTPCSCCSRWLLPAGQGWFCTVRVPAASVQR